MTVAEDTQGERKRLAMGVEERLRAMALTPQEKEHLIGLVTLSAPGDVDKALNHVQSYRVGGISGTTDVQ